MLADSSTWPRLLLHCCHTTTFILCRHWGPHLLEKVVQVAFTIFTLFPVGNLININVFFLVLLAEINLNSQRGFTGAGTFWCRHPLCTRGPLMTSSPVVQWGPAANQVLHLRSRLTCSSNNTVSYPLFWVFTTRGMDELRGWKRTGWGRFYILESA